MVKFLLPALFVVFASLLCPLQAEAQRYRYMDSSGNLHFVDSLGEIPRQYRQQVVPATPTPVLTTQQRNELKRAKDREIKQRQQQMERTKRENDRIRRSLERDQKLQSGRGGSVSAPTSQKAPALRDDIEVIR